MYYYTCITQAAKTKALIILRRRLICAFVVRIWQKTGFLMTWLNYYVIMAFFSSPDAKAHTWAYSIARRPSVNIFKRHLWSHKTYSNSNFKYSVKGVGRGRGVVAHVLSLLWQLSSNWLVMGKVKIGIYCYLTADILTKVFQKYLLNGPLPNIYFLSKLLNLIG